jgi:methylase of polypeptide subunit release factors
MLFLETGYDQGEAVCALARAAGRFEDITVIKDLAGHDRAVRCRLKAPEKK